MKKKEKKNIIDRQVQNNLNPEIKTAIKIVCGILIVFLLVYLIAGLLTGEIKLGKEKKQEVSIQYSEILAEQTFKQNKDEYFVMFYDFESNSASLMQTISGELSQNISVYEVDLNKKFNKNYISEGKLNTKPSKISELKVTNPTLIKIKNKKVDKFLTGIEKIKQYTLNQK